jgi:hemoglobin
VIRVCDFDDVPAGEGRAVTVAGRRVALFRADDGWFALDGVCPHRGGPLSDGIVAERSVICPLHERRFDLISGQELSGGCGVAAHRVHVRGRDVYLDLKEHNMEQSIYDSIGGAAAVEAAVELFYEKVWGDPDLLGYFTGIDPERLKGHQRAFISAALGGPDAYAGRPMDEAHRSRGITDEAFDRVVEHLADTLAELGVAEDTVAVIAESLAPLRGDVVQRPAATAA